MVAHRKNVPTPQAYVPSSWFIVLTVLVVVGAAGWLGWLFVDDDPPPNVTTSPSAASTGAPSPSAPTDPAPAATGTPKPEKSKPEPTATSATARKATVSVLNNSGVRGAARAFSAKVTEAGWTLGGIGNWTGSIGSNTVYYPAALQDQAELLAKDVDIDRVRPSVAPMRMDRLTIILSGPQ